STLRQVETYRATNGGNLFGDLIAAEIADGSRIVARNEHWIAFVPFAARWPVEVHLFPRVQVADLPALTPPQKLSLAPIYLEVLRRLEGVFQDSLPAVTAWHQAPVHTGRDDFWLHLQIFTIRRDIGKIKYLAGSEAAMGAFVNDISPEDAAQRLRQARLSTADDLGPLSLLTS
ncbi:MAG: galactose-1-phosphate uridylyltransferase, partial [Actinomycetota bacterium]|nr:galactose-1-phosphate uridylyltransferase [Actinomycetota bacterium]